MLCCCLRPAGRVRLRRRAAEVGCAPSQLYDWHAALGSQVTGKPGAESLEDEVKRLRREVSQVTRERDFLKKVHAFFVKDSL